MKTVIAKCIKETYTWHDEQYHFCNCKLNHVYSFNKIDSVYWLDKQHSPDKQDFVCTNGFINADRSGLPARRFREMFEIISNV